MQTKYKVPPDVRHVVLGYVSGYKRLKQWYKDARGDILYGSGRGYDEYTMEGGETARSYVSSGSGVGDITARQAAKLEQLERHHNVKVVRAIEQARADVTAEVEDQRSRDRIGAALIWSCERGRGHKRFVFERAGLPMGCGSFYRMRAKFIWQIAKAMDML